MEFNNKTILITGLIICSAIAMFCNYEQIALAIVSGLVGYLSKDINDSTLVSNDQSVLSNDSNDLSVESSEEEI